MLLNVYATLRDVPEPRFPHRLVNRRDRRDAELGRHLDGFMGYVMGGGTRPMTAMRYHVLQHLGRVQHHLSLEVDLEHRAALEAWAIEANAILFTPDGHVRAPDGAVLVAGDSGEPAPGARMPYPPDAVRRRDATAAVLRARGITTPEDLPPIPSEGEVEFRTPADVARRCLALFACAVRAESFASGQPIPRAELAARLPIAVEAMSPGELAFASDRAPDQQAVVNHAWRYEALAVLWWAIGGTPSLGFPEAPCDVPALAKAMLSTPGEAIVAAARLRSTTELLDALDLTYRLAWAVTDARINDRAPLDGIEPGVVAERHYALNWLTRFENADWDDVTTPT